jgi:predicted NAD/FAD-binding protein
MKIAIIGSGIAGLTCAWRLAGQHEVTLFEAASTPGAYRHGGYRHAAGYLGHRYRIHRV